LGGSFGSISGQRCERDGEGARQPPADSERRGRAGKVIVLCSHRIGLELSKAPLAKPPGKKIGNLKLPISGPATLAELAGYKMKGHRLIRCR
jgi:hypothetical protein